MYQPARVEILFEEMTGCTLFCLKDQVNHFSIIKKPTATDYRPVKDEGQSVRNYKTDKQNEILLI